MNYKKYFFLGLLAALLWGLWGFNTQAHDPHDVVQQVELSPAYSQDRSLYLLVRGNFLTSTDGGSTWQRRVQGLNHQTPLTAFAVAPSDPNYLYLTTEGDGIYQSVNGGRAWQPLNQGLPELNLGKVAVASTDAERVFVAGHDGGLYRRDGDTWALTLSTEVPVSAISAASERILVGDQQGQLYRSTDTGQTWTPLGRTDSAITSISAADTDSFWIGTDGAGVFRTQNGGQTLTAVAELPEPSVQDIVSPDGTQLFVSTSSQGVFYSDNGGDSWQPADSGLTKTDQADKMGFPHFTDLALSPDQDGTLFASGFNGLFKTTNQGESWQQLDTLPGGLVMALGVSPDYGNDSTVVALTYVGEAYMSPDGGDSWTPMAKGLELPLFTDSLDPIDLNDDPRRFQSLAFSPSYAEDKIVFATILNNGVLRYSPNSGWELQAFKDWERAIAIAPSPNFAQDQIIFVGTQKGRIYRSDDGGKSFNKVSEIAPQFGNESPFMVVSPNYAEDKTVFITGAAGVYKSTDVGWSWQTVTTPDQIENRLKLKLAISPNYGEDQTLWLGTTSGLLQTQDGGDTWTEVTTYGDSPYIEAVAVSPNYREDQTLLVSVRGQGLFKSTDGGRTATAVGDPTIPLAIVNNFEYGAMPLVFSPNYAEDKTVFGFGSVTGEIFKSVDGAQTWQTLPLPDAEIFAAYSSYEYSPWQKVQFFFHIYQKRLLKLALAGIAGLVVYAALSVLSRFVKVGWLGWPVRLGAAVGVMGMAIALLLF
ncbi:MAG: YCF48-related protein [Leptolyngbyaceae cyanobacterium]